MLAAALPMAVIGTALAVSAGCSSASRHRILTIFFDGVPPPADAAAAPGATAGKGAGASARKAIQGSHGPYAAKLCNGCHKSSSDNSLVAPRDQLCQRCHEIEHKRAYLHGPLASGGCLACHDPHGSGYRFLLVAEPTVFCRRCHEAGALSPIPEHAAADSACTDCHDAHMSDRKFLLR